MTTAQQLIMFDETHWVDDGDGNAVPRPDWLRHTEINVHCNAHQGLHVFAEFSERWPDEDWPDEEIYLYDCVTFENLIEDLICGFMDGPLDPNGRYGRSEDKASFEGDVTDKLKGLRNYLDDRIAYLETLPEAPHFATNEQPTEGDEH